MATFYRVHAEARTSPYPIALLLRSFGNVHGYLDVGTGFSIFWLLDEALRETGLQPVLLGTDASLPEDHGTLLMLTEDEKWQEVFEVFADAAAVIIVVPELTGSLQTELQLLRERGWLAKSVAVMTPASVCVQNIALDPGVALGGDDTERRDRWEAARERYALQSLKLPPYDADGALIEWSGNGNISASNLLSFKPRSFHENVPHSLLRRESFCRCWRSIQDRRRFRGKSTSETYLPMAPALKASSHKSVLDPPGNDGRLEGALVCLALFGWVVPLAFLFLSFLI